jgi:hypothetical protein
VSALCFSVQLPYPTTSSFAAVGGSRDWNPPSGGVRAPLIFCATRPDLEPPSEQVQLRSPVSVPETFFSSLEAAGFGLDPRSIVRVVAQRGPLTQLSVEISKNRLCRCSTHIQSLCDSLGCEASLCQACDKFATIVRVLQNFLPPGFLEILQHIEY